MKQELYAKARKRKDAAKERAEKKVKNVSTNGDREAPYDLEKVLKALGECSTTAKSNTTENSKKKGKKAKKARKQNQLKRQEIVGSDTIKQETTLKIQPQISCANEENAKLSGNSLARNLEVIEMTNLNSTEKLIQEYGISKEGRDTIREKAKKERKRNQQEEEFSAKIVATNPEIIEKAVADWRQGHLSSTYYSEGETNSNKLETIQITGVFNQKKENNIPTEVLEYLENIESENKKHKEALGFVETLIKRYDNLNIQNQNQELQIQTLTVQNQNFENRNKNLEAQTKYLEDQNKYLEDQAKNLKEENLCKICMENEISFVFIPCGHLITCENCAVNGDLKICPMCRKQITKRLKTYLS